IWPVIAAASSDTRNAVAAATSSGCTTRPIGGRRDEAAAAGSNSIGVSVAVGDTTLAVMAAGRELHRPRTCQPDKRRLGGDILLRPANPEAVRLPISTMRP